MTGFIPTAATRLKSTFDFSRPIEKQINVINGNTSPKMILEKTMNTVKMQNTMFIQLYLVFIAQHFGC